MGSGTDVVIFLQVLVRLCRECNRRLLPLRRRAILGVEVVLWGHSRRCRMHYKRLRFARRSQNRSPLRRIMVSRRIIFQTDSRSLRRRHHNHNHNRHRNLLSRSRGSPRVHLHPPSSKHPLRQVQRIQTILTPMTLQKVCCSNFVPMKAMFYSECQAIVVPQLGGLATRLQRKRRHGSRLQRPRNRRGEWRKRPRKNNLVLK